MAIQTTFLQILLMMLYAVPGYILVRLKKIEGGNIPSFSRILMFVCQPCLTIYSFNKATYTPELLLNMGLVFAVSFVLQVGLIGIYYLVLRKKYDDAAYRVFTAAMIFGNVGFLGVPLLEALMPQYPDAVAFSATFIVSMNIISWTLGLFILTGDKKYFSVKKLLLNPPIISLIVALPLFILGIKLPSILDTGVTVLAKMTTPLCMLILGMRLATIPIKDLVSDWRPFVVAAMKMIVFPLLMYASLYFLPIDNYMKIAMFILACCPTASIVQNLAELTGAGASTAANQVLISTVLCIITIPLMLLLC